MIIEAFIIAFNESSTIDMTIRHYEKFCDSVTIFDNYSTDETCEIAEHMGCIVKKFGTPGVLSDADYLKVKNHEWKGSNADWVIVCDADEILHHREIKRVLSETKASIITTQGYSFFSRYLPNKSFFELDQCVRDDNYSKRIIFNPKRVKEIGYIYGCHECRPIGDISYSDAVVDVLHFKYIGGIDRLLNRHQLYKSRLSDINKRWNLGHTYSLPESDQRAYFNEMISKCESYKGY